MDPYARRRSTFIDWQQPLLHNAFRVSDRDEKEGERERESTGACRSRIGSRTLCRDNGFRTGTMSSLLTRHDFNRASDTNKERDIDC